MTLSGGEARPAQDQYRELLYRSLAGSFPTAAVVHSQTRPAHTPNMVTPLKKVPIHLQSSQNRLIIKNGTVVNWDKEEQLDIYIEVSGRLLSHGS